MLSEGLDAALLSSSWGTTMLTLQSGIQTLSGLPPYTIRTAARNHQWKHSVMTTRSRRQFACTHVCDQHITLIDCVIATS